MFKKVSFKAVLLGALADVGGSNIWGIVVAIYIVSKYQTYLLPHAQQVGRLQDIMMHDPLIFTLNMIIGSGFSILGGYIAARIAKHNELLNGTLASFLCEIFAFAAIGSTSLWVIIVSLLANPLLGLAGGYLQLRQKKKKTKSKNTSK